MWWLGLGIQMQCKARPHQSQQLLPLTQAVQKSEARLQSALDSGFSLPFLWCHIIQIKTNGKRSIINILDVIMFLHWILRTTWLYSEPTLLVAVQRYCPESESTTLSILRRFPLISTWLGRDPPTLLQRTVGSGSPIAWHSNSTELPTITVCTDVRTLIITLGRAVKTKSTKSLVLKFSNPRFGNILDIIADLEWWVCHCPEPVQTDL